MNMMDTLGELATRSILLEVSCHPKPGLVTPFSRGAHRDMDYTLFLRSSAVLSQGFRDVAMMGYEHEGDAPSLLPVLRGRGIVTERRMFDVTAGVNTQKGLVFLFYLLLGASGRAMRSGDHSVHTVTSTVADITSGIVERELGGLRTSRHGHGLTKGEKLYLEHGITGIRGEVERGLPSVRGKGLPALREVLARGGTVNDAIIQALFALMTSVEDTNIISRCGLDTYEMVRERASEVIASGGTLTNEGTRMIREFNEMCEKRNISPGGSADLVSATLYLHFLEEEHIAPVR
jgi:triphosphoribosyl-dephospho-CoA synthase CitG